MNEQPLNWQPTAAAIFVKLGRDKHLASCGLAKESGPDATLACANCGRALWMHSTRHDTCGRFCWVTERTLTTQQIGLLGTITGLPEMIRLACSRALNDYCLAPYYVREARQTCAVAINNAKRAERTRVAGFFLAAIKLGSHVKVTRQPDRDHGYRKEDRAERQVGDTLTGVAIAEHDSHGLCYEVKFASGTVITYDREELEVVPSSAAEERLP